VAHTVTHKEVPYSNLISQQMLDSALSCLFLLPYCWSCYRLHSCHLLISYKCAVCRWDHWWNVICYHWAGLQSGNAWDLYL